MSANVAVMLGPEEQRFAGAQPPTRCHLAVNVQSSARGQSWLLLHLAACCSSPQQCQLADGCTSGVLPFTPSSCLPVQPWAEASERVSCSACMRLPRHPLAVSIRANNFNGWRLPMVLQFPFPPPAGSTAGCRLPCRPLVGRQGPAAAMVHENAAAADAAGGQRTCTDRGLELRDAAQRRESPRGPAGRSTSWRQPHHSRHIRLPALRRACLP